MAHRDRLLAEREPEVLALDPEAEKAAAELLGLVLDRLALEGITASRPVT